MIDDAAPNPNGADTVITRLATHHDGPELCRLFEDGRVEGQIKDGDTDDDLRDLSTHYFTEEDDGGAFWVAEIDQRLIGMVGVRKLGDSAAEVRRLRVDADYRRRGVGTRLMELALTFCQEHGYLKIVLDVRIERAPAIAMFEKFGFKLSRTRDAEGRKLLDFYMDLYREPG